VPDKVGIPPSCTGWNTGHTICTAWKNPLPPEVQPIRRVRAQVRSHNSSTTTQSISMYNWYPINFYDAREGEVRNNQVANNSCATNGVMNAVENRCGQPEEMAGGIDSEPAAPVWIMPCQNGYVCTSQIAGACCRIRTPLLRTLLAPRAGTPPGGRDQRCQCRRYTRRSTGANSSRQDPLSRGRQSEWSVRQLRSVQPGIGLLRYGGQRYQEPEYSNHQPGRARPLRHRSRRPD